MGKRQCPNCGRTTERTEDWACQWCGYPLLSESYQKIPKTYKQLKEEKLYKQKPPELEAELIAEPEPELAPEPQPEPIVEPEPKLAPELEAKPIPELEPGPSPTPIEVTTEQLHSAYIADKVATDAKFTDKILKVTGVVDRIVVRDIHDIYYILLTSAEKKKEWNVRCTFDKKHVPKLNRLTAGQTATVQGNYDGYRINILLRDCVLAP